MTTTITDATRATMDAWAAIAQAAAGRTNGARFGAILATFDGETVADAPAIIKTGIASKSTVHRDINVALAVARALGADNIPTPSAKNADTLVVFSSLGGALGKVDATHRSGILERLGKHANNLAELVKRAESLLEEAKEAREATPRGARPEGNKPAETVAETVETVETGAAETVTGPRPLSSILGELYAHLNSLPAEDLADALDEVSALIDEVSARIFA